MRNGTPVSVRALIAMPGVADGQIIHTRWDTDLAVLVAAGRFAILDQPTTGTSDPPAPDPVPVADPAHETTATTTPSASGAAPADGAPAPDDGVPGAGTSVRRKAR